MCNGYTYVGCVESIQPGNMKKRHVWLDFFWGAYILYTYVLYGYMCIMFIHITLISLTEVLIPS